jgi:hydrogenase/urease accessory protein HupE
MEKIARVILGIIGILSAPVALFAHPGHGHESPLSPGHYVANPEHFLPLALTIGVVLIAALGYQYYLSHPKQKK